MQRAIVFLGLFALSCATAADRLVVGLSGLPPNTKAEQGQQIPFSAAVVREAARRAAIQIEFRETGNGIEVNRALDSGAIDLSPAAVPTAERRAKYFVTESWWHDDLLLLVRTGGPQDEAALDGKRIAVKMVMLAEPARERFPHALIMATPEATVTSAAAMVCTGAAEAALMTRRDAMVVALSRPPACTGVGLSSLSIADPLGVALMSRPDKAALTRRLRRAIDSLTEDGTLARIAAQYPYVSASSAIALAERIRQAGHLRTLRLVIAGLILFGLAACLFSWRLYVLQRRLRFDIQARLSVEQALRRSNEDLQAYLYTVSHDLQEPLRMVATHTELLRRTYVGCIGDAATPFMDVIHEGAVRMATMLADLVKFSAVDQDPDPPCEVDTNRCVRSVLQKLRNDIAEADASVTIGPMPLVHGWGDRIEQVFQNLIENALKYRRAGDPVSLEIQAERTGDMWTFSVTDNGVGMNMEYRDRIFRVFQRLHRRSEYKGNGIGLAISKRIVERHGGRIWVDWSEIDQGTRFCFTLPARIETVSPTQPAVWRAAAGR